MTLEEVDKEVNDIISKHGSAGAKVIITSLVQAMKRQDAFTRVGAGAYGPALIRLMIAAVRSASEEDQNNG